MAQVIVKSLKSNKEPKESKEGLDNLPEVKETDKKIKIASKNRKNNRTRAGNIQMGINPYGKPTVIENGNKIK